MLSRRQQIIAMFLTEHRHSPARQSRVLRVGERAIRPLAAQHACAPPLTNVAARIPGRPFSTHGPASGPLMMQRR